MNKNKKNRKGFTIVELVIVIAVIGILATVLVPTFGDVLSDAKEKALLQEAKSAYSAYMSKHAVDGTIEGTVYYANNNGWAKIENGNAKLGTGDKPTVKIEMNGSCSQDDNCAVCKSGS